MARNGRHVDVDAAQTIRSLRIRSLCRPQIASLQSVHQNATRSPKTVPKSRSTVEEAPEACAVHSTTRETTEFESSRAERVLKSPNNNQDIDQSKFGQLKIAIKVPKTRTATRLAHLEG